MFEFEYPKITKEQITPGIFRIDHDDYHNGAGVSSSTLKKVLISPAHALVPEEDKPHFTFGRSLHMRLIEPEIWDDNNVVLPQVYRRSKNEKTYWGLVEAAKTGPVQLTDEHHAAVMDALKDDEIFPTVIDMLKTGLVGKEIIDSEQKQLIDEMASAVEKTRSWTAIKGYDGETAGFHIDGMTGLLRKCKADLLGGSVIVDLKSTAQSAKPENFLREAYQRQYHVSAAYYQDIFRELTGTSFDFVWLAVEKPKKTGDLIGVSYVRCPPELLDVGHEKWRTALSIYADCKSTGVWPCYPDMIVDVRPKKWMLR